MNRSIVVALLGTSLLGCAEWRGAGREIGATGKTVGHEVKDAAINVGHEARDAAKDLGHATADAAREARKGVKK